MVSLLTGVAPDEDFFWPECPIAIHHEAGTTRVFLR